MTKEPTAGTTYRIKGCPICGTQPVFTMQGEGRDRSFTLECPNHLDFPARSSLDVERLQGTGVPDGLQWVLFSAEQTMEELINEWNCDHANIMCGADPQFVASLKVFEVSLATAPNARSA